MIHSVLIVNNSGLPRLTKFYTQIDLQTQSLLLKQVHSILSSRSANQCSFLTPPPLLSTEDDDVRVIYRHYATLYFVFIVDEQESELGILDLIQVCVESLDAVFGGNVCELDLIFGFDSLQTVINEMIQGGLVVETNINKIVAAVDEANRGITGASGSGGSSVSSSFTPGGNSGGGGGTDDNSFSRAFSNATSAFQAMTREGRMWPSR